MPLALKEEVLCCCRSRLGAGTRVLGQVHVASFCAHEFADGFVFHSCFVSFRPFSKNKKNVPWLFSLYDISHFQVAISVLSVPTFLTGPSELF